MYAGFWQLVLDQDVSLIVMITKLRENQKLKAHQYWPDERYQDFRLNENGNEIKVMEEDEDEVVDGLFKRQFKLTGRGS